MEDDTTQKILEAHAAILDNLAAGQATIAQSLQALIGVVQLQQDEGSQTSKALKELVAGVRAGQASAKAFRERADAAREKMMADLRAGEPPRLVPCLSIPAA